MPNITIFERNVLNVKAAYMWQELIMSFRRVTARVGIDHVDTKIAPADTKLRTVGDYTVWKQAIKEKINDAGLLGHFEGTAIRPQQPASAVERFDKNSQIVKDYILQTIKNPVIQETVLQSLIDGEASLATPIDIMKAVAAQTRKQRVAYFEMLDELLTNDGTEYANIGALAAEFHGKWLDIKANNPTLSDDVYINVMLRVTKKAYPDAYLNLESELFMGTLTVTTMRAVLLDEADRGIVGEGVVMVRAQQNTPAAF
ncbi:hypothetical protein JDV02_005074 [Purpureocillium takamizusanense]|uniref:Uncharacterized protein n=1 Tax=Purpureocillium takamizusanense TaxID=2060973 RepID=A0A9Q8VAM1_9HYPO|nr:uncharacterized protein JDV02_005074 [Purpureocillium takamizusanense]UNI18828.1 hypothetical protein JDV02_005074 [Purpureocillium takamizusanense]